MEINISELLVERFRNRNLKFVFGILSSGFLELGDILYDKDIKYIGTRHEQWAGHMADVFGRITGQPQLLLLPGGPGVTNALTSIATAKINYAPMFVLSDGSTTSTSGRGDFQDLDGPEITKPVTKKSVLVQNPARVGEYFSSLYSISKAPLPGPVHLEIPRDVLLMKTTYADDKSEPDFLFGNYPARETVRLILHAIIKAKRPVVLVGNELSTTLGRELLSQFAEKMNVPVIAVHGKNDIMDNNNPRMMGAIGRLGSRKAMTYLKESDMVVALGTNMNPYTFSPYYGFEYNNLTENVILITLDPENIGNNIPISKNLFCSPESFLRVALGVIESEEYKFKGKAIREFFENAPEHNDEIFKGKHNSFVFQTIFENVLPGSNISIDAGSMSMVMLKWKGYSSPGHLITSGNMGEVGFSISASIGASLAQPEVPSYAFLGDGAFTMQLSALITAVEYNIPIKILVFDNSAWGSEKAYQTLMYNGRFFGSNLKNPDLTEVARSLRAISTKAEDPQTLRSTLHDINNST